MLLWRRRLWCSGPVGDVAQNFGEPKQADHGGDERNALKQFGAAEREACLHMHGAQSDGGEQQAQQQAQQRVSDRSAGDNHCAAQAKQVEPKIFRH